MDKELTFEKLPSKVVELCGEIKELKEVIMALTNKQDSQAAKEFINAEEAAQLLNISKNTIYSKSSNGLIPAIKRGNRIYFVRTELEEYMRTGKFSSVEKLKEDAITNLSKNRKR